MDQEFFKQVMESLYEGVYFVDRDRKISYWNQGAERLTGYSKEEVLGHCCADNILRHVDAKGTPLCIEGCPLSATIEDGKARKAEVFFHHKMGHRVPVLVRAIPMRNQGGDIIGAVEIFTNNVKNINALEEIERLQHEVFRDALTGIGNRRFAELNLRNFLQGCKEHDLAFGLLFVDIDRFKVVNDTYGHTTGDEVLKLVSKTLVNGLRAVDIPCRWGGEEFLILLPNVNYASLWELAERLRMLLENSWLDHNGVQIQVTASFGGTISNTQDERESIVERADKQLYLSKEAGRNCVHIG
jgi:diguanylate cyclase (GGDEF)-like protein/PAS domain S-box-containing protein